MCPLWLPDDVEELTECEQMAEALLEPAEKRIREAAVEQRRKEDGVISEGVLTWCVNWSSMSGKRAHRRDRTLMSEGVYEIVRY